MTKRTPVLIVLVAALAVAGLFAQEKAADPETQSAVPELEAFHEVIYPIWHTAYPEKDLAALKGYVPQVNELAAKIYAAKLPGILREKDAAWKAGVAKFKAAVEAYDAAAAGSNGQALLDAAEALHMRYEMLVRVIRPVLPEMEAFHKDLYVVYHRYLPGKKWDDVRKAAPALKAQAEAVTKARLPKRLEARAEAFKAASAGLLAAAAELERIAPSAAPAALEAAVNGVHAKYRALEKVFE
ncbi:MAG TPA: hypothetical protein VMS75_10415 [Terriglobales bacterium]|nr:hypothetical protein [Terriglobales bacterium]